MKLLICTQAVDRTDSNLGFFHRWIEEFAEHCEQVIVVCLRKGDYSLPSNVRVLSLGKEEGNSRFARVLKFYSYIIANRRDYDAVFVHMNAEYIVLGGPLWRHWGKKVSLWYAHKSVTNILKYALRFVDIVFTSSSQGFRTTHQNVQVIGQGIDTKHFKPTMRESSIDTRIITVGRVAQSKRLTDMLDVLDVLHSRGELFTFTVVGEPTNPVEEKYAAQLRQEIGRRPYNARVHMRGALLHENLPQVLNFQDIFFSLGATGSMDKAVLEALASGTPVLSTNEAFKTLLHPHDLFVPSTHPTLIADALQRYINKSDREKSGIAATLRNKVVEEHSLEQLIPKILSRLA